MSPLRSGSKRRTKESKAQRSEKIKREEEDFDPDLSSDLNNIISALNHFKERAQKDGQKKNEETISSVHSEIKSMTDETKSKIEKDRQSFVKIVSKSSKEWESYLKNQSAKFQTSFDNFSKEKLSHHQALKEIFSKIEEEKEKLLTRYEQQRKKDKALLAELEKACAEKIATAEDSIKKNKKVDKSVSFLRRSLGDILGTGLDEDFPFDD